MSDNPLKQAQELYKRGELVEAQKLAVGYVFENRDDPKGWWALANIAQDPDVKIKSLKNVLRLKPEFEQARAMLNELAPAEVSYGGTITQPQGKKPLPIPQQKPPKTTYGAGFYIPVFFGLAICLVCMCCFGTPYLIAANADKILEMESLGFGQHVTPAAQNPRVTRAVIAMDETGLIIRTVFVVGSPAYVYLEFAESSVDLRVVWYQIHPDGRREKLDTQDASYSDWAFFSYTPTIAGNYEAELYYNGQLDRTFAFSVQ